MSSENQPLRSAVPVGRAEILEEVDHAIRDHLTWLRDWHRLVVCDAPLIPEN